MQAANTVPGHGSFIQVAIDATIYRVEFNARDCVNRISKWTARVVQMYCVDGLWKYRMKPVDNLVLRSVWLRGSGRAIGAKLGHVVALARAKRMEGKTIEVLFAPRPTGNRNIDQSGWCVTTPKASKLPDAIERELNDIERQGIIFA